MDWVDRVWVGLAWLVGAAAVAVIAWGLAGDWHQRRRSAKRGVPVRRCRRCGYDMRGAASTTCPECGRAGTERELTRAWVRKWVVAVGVLLLVPAWVAGRVPEARRVGWDRLMPDVLYVSIAPVNDEDWRARWLRPLDAMDFRKHGPLARRIVATRRASAMRREHPDWRVEIFDVTNPELPEWESVPESIVEARSVSRARGQPNNRDRQDEYNRDVRSLVTYFIEEDVWSDNGGDAGEMIGVTDRLVIGSSPEVMTRAGRLIAAMQERANLPHLSEEDGLLRIRCGALLQSSDAREYEEQVRDLRNTIVALVQTDSWIDNGGDDGRLCIFYDFILVKAPPPMRAQVAKLLWAIERAEHHGEATRLPLYRFTWPIPEGQSTEEHTAVWPLGEIRDCWDGMDSIDWDRWVQRYDMERVDLWGGPWPWWYRWSAPLIPTKVSLMGLGRDRAFSTRCETSDDEVKGLSLGRCLIATAPDASTLDAIEENLRELGEDVRAGVFGHPGRTSPGQAR